jgi:hypothetical protein
MELIDMPNNQSTFRYELTSITYFSPLVALPAPVWLFPETKLSKRPVAKCRLGMLMTPVLVGRRGELGKGIEVALVRTIMGKERER